MKNTQVNIAMPLEWRTILEKRARVLSAREDRDISYQDIIRNLIEKEIKSIIKEEHERK